MRRYWLPACLSEDVAEPDGPPRRAQRAGAGDHEIALAVLILIVWWTMFSGRPKGELPRDDTPEK